MEKYLRFTQNYLLKAFATLPIYLSYLHSHNEHMIVYFYHNLLCTCYWVFHIDKSSDWRTSNTFFFLPLITYQYQLKDLILLQSNLKLLAMLIQEMKQTLQDQYHIFQDTYFESCQIH